jgi:hypothetical protein
LDKAQRLNLFIGLELAIGAVSLVASGWFAALCYAYLLIIPLAAFHPYVKEEGRKAGVLYGLCGALAALMILLSLQ